MTTKRIYLDYNATTPCDPRVLEAMLPYFSEKFGNAASRSHSFGWEAEEAVDLAREQVAALIGADPKEIVFTSGATESVNLALKGVFALYHQKGQHIVTVKTEHKAVLDTCKALEQTGAEVSYLEVDRQGLLDPDQLDAAIREDTILVAVMWANNETGVLQPVEDIGRICEAKGVLFFSDATQAVGKVPVDVRSRGVHLLALSAHKLYGPKGAGALYVRQKQPRVKLAPLIHGGGHERGMRSGTLNVPGIAGLGKACTLAAATLDSEYARLSALRDRLEQALLRIEEAQANGGGAPRLPHVSNLAFYCADAEQLMMSFGQRLAVSSGSACSAAQLAPSHVLRAMGLSDDLAHASLRFSLGRFTTDEEVETAADLVRTGVAQLRELSPVWEMFRDGVDLEGG